MAPRKKQEYDERAADEDGTPMERFKRLAAKVITVPKAKLDEREQTRTHADSGQ